MLRNRKDYPVLNTPKATVVWASIDEPDYDYKDGGEFHVKVRFDPADSAWDAIREQAESILDEAFEATKKELTREKKGALLKKLHKRESGVFTPDVDRETGEETGMAILRAGMKFRVEVKNGPNAGKTYEFTPDVFDARGKQLKKRPRVGSGSKVKLAVRIMEYFISKDGEMGITYGLEAIQIIDLVQGGQRDAESYGFAAEDGYQASDDSGGFDDEGEGFTADDDEADADF